MKKGLRRTVSFDEYTLAGLNIFPDEEGIKTHGTHAFSFRLRLNIFPDEEGIKTLGDQVTDGVDNA